MRQLLASFVLFVLFASHAFAQEDVMSSKTLYWFNVKVYTLVNTKSKIDEYGMRLISKHIYSGNAEKFKYSLWKGCSSGTGLAVGPFKSMETAKRAVEIFGVKSDTSSVLSLSGSASWFLIKVGIMQRSHSYRFERMAAAVASGSVKQFYDMMKESPGFQKIAIGPFDCVIDAEEAKQLYRLEE